MFHLYVAYVNINTSISVSPLQYVNHNQIKGPKTYFGILLHLNNLVNRELQSCVQTHFQAHTVEHIFGITFEFLSNVLFNTLELWTVIGDEWNFHKQHW